MIFETIFDQKRGDYRKEFFVSIENYSTPFPFIRLQTCLFSLNSFEPFYKLQVTDEYANTDLSKEI